MQVKIGFNKTITLYNSVKEEKITWHKVVLKNCFYGKKSELIGDSSAFAKKTVEIVRIPKNDMFVEVLTKELAEQGYFTLKVGSVVVNGEVSDTIADNTSANDLLSKYTGKSFEVKSKEIFDEPLSLAHYKGSD